MPNIGVVLKSEITRLSRKEAKSESDALRKASTQHRKEIAALKRKVGDLEKAVKRLTGAPGETATNSAVTPSSIKAARFVPKGLVSARKRLGLSQATLAGLLGVSSLTVYNWEKGNTRPRQAQLQKIVALRSISKAQVEAHLSAQR